MIRFAAYLPLSVLYGLSSLAYYLVYYVIRYRRKVVAKNLRNSFPSVSRAELTAIEKKYYRNLCDIVAEVVKGVRLSREEINKRVQFTNPEVLSYWINKGKPVVVLAAHHSNWEWAILGGNAYFPFPLNGVYKTIKQPAVNDFMRSLRSRFGGRPVTMDQVILYLKHHLNEPQVYAVVNDQIPRRRAQKYWTTFLEQETAFAVGGERMARLFQLPVCAVHIVRLRRGYYRVSFTELALPPHQKNDTTILENYVTWLEQTIREHPEQWLWSHNRWKRGRNAREKQV
jgi:Kdo2-lipid IVA lauroyltransferase/acyltransferase